MLALLLLLATAAAPTPPPVLHRVVVLQVVDDGGGAEFAAQLTTRTISELQEDPRFEVVGPVTPAVKVCDDLCRGTIAGVKSAQLVLAMTARRRNHAVIVEILVYDAVAGRTLDIQTIEAASIPELIAPLRAARDRMLLRAFEPPTFPRVVFIGGGVLTGLGIVGTSVGVAGFLLNSNRAADADTDAAREDHERLQERFAVVTIASGVALVAGATMMMVDVLAEAQSP